jgi:hypothetical protein
MAHSFLLPHRKLDLTPWEGRDQGGDILGYFGVDRPLGVFPYDVESPRD